MAVSLCFFFFSSRRRHTRSLRDWSSDVCSSDLLAAGGTLALNQYLERDVDARMERTKRRPLPEGRLKPPEALLFASALASLGVAYLAKIGRASCRERV